MRYKLADANDPRDFEFPARLAAPPGRGRGAASASRREIESVEAETDYAFRASSTTPAT